MKRMVLLFVSFMVVNECTWALSEKQMEAAVKMVRNVCQPKTKATDQDIDKMHKGDWNIDHSAMCYMWCGLNMYKLMTKENTFNYEVATKQFSQLPDSFKKSAGDCMEKCKDSAKTLDDKCVAAYELTHCFYVCNPEKYFLP